MKDEKRELIYNVATKTNYNINKNEIKNRFFPLARPLFEI